MAELNQDTYNKTDVVESYNRLNFLFKAEENIFREQGQFLKSARVLDIGIGAGRTTQFLAPLCKAYVGVDYSESFVKHCTKRFASLQNARFQFADARNMDEFEDQSFDFILFSFNGIDCVNFEGRKQVLQECYRLLSKDGLLCFSYHNANYIPQLFSLLLGKNPIHWPANWRRYRTINRLHPDHDKLAFQDYCILRDGADDFGTDVLYIKPDVQEQQLSSLGFVPKQYLDAAKGIVIGPGELPASKSQWIYTLSKKKA